MRRKGRPKKQKTTKLVKVPGKRGRPRKKEVVENEPPRKKAKRGRPRLIKVEQVEGGDPLDLAAPPNESTSNENPATPDDNFSEGLHMSTMQIRALGTLVACLDCGEEVVLGVRPTTKGMISEFTVTCKVCGSQKSTNTPNLIRERKRKREKKGVILQKNENINYAHVASYLDNGLGYSGLRHYCKYFNARCLNEATFIVYAKQVIADVVSETEDFLHQNARIVRKAFENQHDSDFIIDLTVGYTTTYHQWGSDFCLVAGAVIELQTGLVLDYDVGNMYCHVCKINAKKIVSMSPSEMTDWFNKHQDTCEIREWCDEIDQDSEEGIKEIDPKYLEAFIAKKIWVRSLEKFGFRYTTLIHESDERIHSELLKAAPYGDIPIIIDSITNCFSRRKSEHARTSFQNKLKAKCPRERVQTKDRIMYVYAMSIPEYNKFAIGSNIKLRELVRRMEMEEEEYQYATELTIQASEIIPALQGTEMVEDKAAAMKEIGDAFEVEEDPEDEADEAEGMEAEVMEVDEEDEEVHVDDDEEGEEDEEAADEEEAQDDELTVSQGIEVMAEDEEEEEEEYEYEEEEEDEEEESATVKDATSYKHILNEEKSNPQKVSATAPTTSSDNAAKEKENKTTENKSQKVVQSKDVEPSKKESLEEVKKATSSVQSKPVTTSLPPKTFTTASTAKKGPEVSMAKKSVAPPDKKVVPSTSQQGQSSASGDKKTASSGEKSTEVKESSRSQENKTVSTTFKEAPSGKKIVISGGGKTPSSEKNNPPGASTETKKIVVVTSTKKPEPVNAVKASSNSTTTVIKSSMGSSQHKKEDIKKRSHLLDKKPFSSGEVRKVAPPEDTKMKTVVVEKRIEGKGSMMAVSIRKDFHKNESSISVATTSSGSEKRTLKEPAKTHTKSLSENGMESTRPKPAPKPPQPEVVKPFRVDFGEED